MSTEPIEERLAALAERLAAAELTATRAQDRGDVENVFSRYMHYHNAFEDERIIDELWVRRGTEEVRSQYNDDGVYTDWDTRPPHRSRSLSTTRSYLRHPSRGRADSSWSTCPSGSRRVSTCTRAASDPGLRRRPG